MQNENTIEENNEEKTTQSENESTSHQIVHEGQIKGTRFGDPIRVGVSTESNIF